MSTIRKHIREILIEALSGPGSFSINPNIKRFCDGFLAGRNPEIHITKRGGTMEITLFASSTMVGTLKFSKTTRSMGRGRALPGMKT